MTGLAEQLALVGDDLESIGVSAALVGGLAVSVRTEPRFTRDIDLALAVADDRAAEICVREFAARGYSILAQIEHEGTGRLATVRTAQLRSGSSGVIVDLLFASSGIEPEIVAEAEPLEVAPGVVLATARVGHLIATKLLARDDRTRPTDAADLLALIAVADDEQRRLARAACAMIVERGFHRGRDLVASLAAAVADS